MIIAFIIILKISNLNKNKKYTTGKIVQFYNTNKGRDSWGISFKYKNSIYESGCPCIGNGCEFDSFNKLVLGKQILVMFDSTNPSNSIGITDKETYKKLSMDFPVFLDSL